jgi:hypothetical protein
MPSSESTWCAFVVSLTRKGLNQMFQKMFLYDIFSHISQDKVQITGSQSHKTSNIFLNLLVYSPKLLKFELWVSLSDAHV